MSRTSIPPRSWSSEAAARMNARLLSATAEDRAERPRAVRTRILGIDPGLRVTGYGLIDRTGQKLVYVTSGVIRTPDAELPERLKAILESLNAVIAQHRPDAGRGGKGVRQRQPDIDAAARSGPRRRDLRGRVLRPAGVRVHRAAGQAGSRGQRSRRQGAGAGDGAPAAGAAGRARARTRPMRWPAPSAMRTVGKGWASSRPPVIACATGGWFDRRALAGTILEKHPPLVLVDVQGVAYEVDVPDEHLLSAAGHRCEGHAAHPPGGARGRAPAVRLRHRRRASGLPPAAQDQRHRRAHRAVRAVGADSGGAAPRGGRTQDSARLIKIPGIGRKTAERLLLELRDKLAE